jgi:hypothetical protein
MTRATDAKSVWTTCLEQITQALLNFVHNLKEWWVHVTQERKGLSSEHPWVGVGWPWPHQISFRHIDLSNGSTTSIIDIKHFFLEESIQKNQQYVHTVDTRLEPNESTHNDKAFNNQSILSCKLTSGRIDVLILLFEDDMDLK